MSTILSKGANTWRWLYLLELFLDQVNVSSFFALAHVSHLLLDSRAERRIVSRLFPWWYSVTSLFDRPETKKLQEEMAPKKGGIPDCSCLFWMLKMLIRCWVLLSEPTWLQLSYWTYFFFNLTVLLPLCHFPGNT